MRASMPAAVEGHNAWAPAPRRASRRAHFSGWDAELGWCCCVNEVHVRGYGPQTDVGVASGLTFLARSVGDFRAEFCNKPTARTSRPFGLLLRMLIHRAAYCMQFFNVAKEANYTGQWAFKVRASAAKRRLFLALPCHPAPARCNTEPTGIPYKLLSRGDPKKKHRRGLPWPLLELSQMGPLWAWGFLQITRY